MRTLERANYPTAEDAGAVQAHLTGKGLSVASVSVTSDSILVDTASTLNAVVSAMADFAPPVSAPSLEERLAALEEALLILSLGA